MSDKGAAASRASTSVPGPDAVPHGGLIPCRNYRSGLEDRCERAATARTIQRLAENLGLRTIAGA